MPHAPWEDRANIDGMAPNYALTVNNNLVDGNTKNSIQQIEYESSDGMADLIRIMIQDTMNERSRFPIINSKMFLPGNEISLWGGYGNKISHIGGAVIRKVIPTFPRSGPPVLEVIAYTPDAQMADTGPEALKDVKNLKSGGRRVKNAKAGRRWSGDRYSDAVRDRAEAYGFLTDIDQSPEAPSDFIQKANMKDYEFLKGISNLTGFIMWVDKMKPGEPFTFHFKDPAKLHQTDIQPTEYIFRYGDGEYSTLLEFQPEFAISQQSSKLQVEMTDPVTGRTFFAKIEEDTQDDPDVLVDPGNVTTGFDAKSAGLSKTANASKSDVKPGKGSLLPTDVPFVGDIQTSSSLKIFIDDYAFDVRANRRFRNEQELALWAAQWFRKNRENFLLCTGHVVGLETLMARQIHTLTGMGDLYDGRYYFTRVRHVFSKDSGYLIDFNGRKVVPELPPVTSTDDLLSEQQLIGAGTVTNNQ